MLRNLNQSSARGRICGTPRVGVRGDLIPATGDDGEAYAYQSVVNRPGYQTKFYRGRITGWPAGLNLFAYEDTSFIASAPDGTYEVPWTFYEDGTEIGTATITLVVGETTVSSDLTASYTVRSFVSADLTASYAVRSTVSADISAAYNVNALVSADLTVAYELLIAGHATVASELAGAYVVYSRVSNDLVAEYSVSASTTFVRAPEGPGYLRSRHETAEINQVSRLVAPPQTLAVSLEEAKSQLRIDGNDMDALVEAWVDGITEHAEHYTGRSFINQTWRVTLDRFPEAIKLYHPPVSSVVQLKFYDKDGVLRTLHPADYELDNASEPGYIVPAVGVQWPESQDRINAVIVEFVCGYGETHASMPKGIKTYIIAKLVEQFDASVKLDKIGESFIDRLLDRYKIWAL